MVEKWNSMGKKNTMKILKKGMIGGFKQERNAFGFDIRPENCQDRVMVISR